jgi:hypothetical protein
MSTKLRNALNKQSLNNGHMFRSWDFYFFCINIKISLNNFQEITLQNLTKSVNLLAQNKAKIAGDYFNMSLPIHIIFNRQFINLKILFI